MESQLHNIVFYDDRGSLELLVGAIVADTPFTVKAFILAQASVTGLIRMPFLMACASRLVKIQTVNEWITASYLTDEKNTEEVWINLLNHVLDGTDKTDKNSAGGLNETELWAFLEILEFNGFEPAELMLSHARKMHSYEH